VTTDLRKRFEAW